MKRFLILLAALALFVPMTARAQYGESASLGGFRYFEREGWSMAVSLSGGYGVKGQSGGFDMGPQVDCGYHFNSWLYLGATFMTRYIDTPDYSYREMSTKIRPQFMLNPRFYFMPGPTAPFLDVRGGVQLMAPFYGQLELMLGCVLQNRFEFSLGISNGDWDMFRDPGKKEGTFNPVFEDIRVCVKLGYRFNFFR